MPVGGPWAETDPLNDTFQPTVHNAFEPARAPSLGAVLAAVPSIEIDFWDDDTWPVFESLPHAWFVRHLPAAGNHSNGRLPGDLRACLLDVRDYFQANPPAFGAFVFLDKKQGWGPTRRPLDLDALLREIFGASIFRPADLAGAASTPRDAIRDRGWCLLRELQGRICFVLTGGRFGLDDQTGSNSVLATYVNTMMPHGLCFVAPDIRRQEEILGAIPGLGALATQWVVMVNNSKDYLHLSPAIHEACLLSRVYDAAESDADYVRCISHQVNFIATDAFGEHHWNENLRQGKFPAVSP